MRARTLFSTLAVLILGLAGCEASNAPASAAASNQAGSDSSVLPRPEVTELPVDAPTHLLFVGNSYLYYGDSVHNHVRRMVIADAVHESDALAYKSATIGGAALRDHNIEHLLQPENLRVDSPFQAVILQGLSSAALSEAGRVRFAEAATRFGARIEVAGGAPVLYMTHAYVEPHRRASADMTEAVARLYIETGNEIGALVIPVGLAFEAAYRQRPDLSLHTSFDGSHPNQAGTYLAAATVYASLYGRSPVGNSYDYFGAVDPDTARFLQTVAFQTTQDFFGRASIQ